MTRERRSNLHRTVAGARAAALRIDATEPPSKPTAPCKARRHLALVPPSRRYAAIVNGYQLVLPSLAWRRLSGAVPDELGAQPADAQAGPRTWNAQIASRLAGELPADLDRSKTIPVVLLPDRPQWQGGPLTALETDLLFGALRRTPKASPIVSTAIDAIGARLILRFFDTGHLEIIPFVSDPDGQPALRVRPHGARHPALHFAFVKPMSMPHLTTSAGAIDLDVATAFHVADLPEDPADLAGLAAELFWDRINPALGRAFIRTPGVMIDRGGESASYASAVELARMALRAGYGPDASSPDAPSLVVELPLHAFGIPRARLIDASLIPKRCKSDVRWARLAEPLAAAILATATRWERHAGQDERPGDPFSSSAAAALRKRTIAISGDERTPTAHAVLLEHDQLSQFWRGHRSDTAVLNALATYPDGVRAKLDELLGS